VPDVPEVPSIGQGALTDLYVFFDSKILPTKKPDTRPGFKVIRF
jgi:hypothetical protein